ncbi:group 10 secretory phospholipase A2-like [Pitangus sulphuratus]|nr:group 10 secretory phospholipase A2-like [Pitangus sulphuratus]
MDEKEIRSSQHGFTKGKSCLTNPIAFHDEATTWVDEGRAVGIVYLDFSGAFNAVSHNILIDKLRKCGVVWKGPLGKSHSLHTRGIIELAGAISCGTGRSPLAYIGYGCYCGLGGRGWPRDKTDWTSLGGKCYQANKGLTHSLLLSSCPTELVPQAGCCHTHDCCYDKAEKAGCSPKVQRYRWACEQNTVRCDNLTDQCEKMVCLCDQEAAKPPGQEEEVDEAPSTGSLKQPQSLVRDFLVGDFNYPDICWRSNR